MANLKGLAWVSVAILGLGAAEFAAGQTIGSPCPSGTSTFKEPKYGVAPLNPIQDSGVRAKVGLKDDGCTLWAFALPIGSGAFFTTGLDPQKHYHSLYYDYLSVAEGPTACLPSTQWLGRNMPEDGFNPFDLLQIDAWQKIGQTNRKGMCGARTGTAYDALVASVQGSVGGPIYAIDTLDTVSIRRHDQEGAMVTLALVACGVINPSSAVEPPDYCK